MICFQQAAVAFLEQQNDNIYCDDCTFHQSNQSTATNGKTDKKDGPNSPTKRLEKYLDRMYDLVQCKNKYKDIPDLAVFAELEKVIMCQVQMELNQET